MKNKNLSYVSGGLMVLAGLIFILSPQGVFESIVLFIGVFLIVISVLGLVFSFSKGNNNSSFLATYIFLLIIGIILVSNTDVAVKIIPVCLGLWFFISGFFTIIAIGNTKDIKVLISPITRVVLGLICFITPVVPISVFGIFIGIVLVLSGINTISNAKNAEVVYKVKVKNVKKK